MGLIWLAGAVVWGVAEATFFFIVPDVLLTFAVLRFGLKAGLRLSAATALSAAIAGLALWTWAGQDATAARHAMLLVPAVGPDLLARTAREMAGFWPPNLFTGAITGVPYKLYAVEAGARGIAVLPFFLVSFVARLARFALSASITALGARVLIRLDRPQWRYPLLALGWTLIYVVYFSIRAAA